LEKIRVNVTHEESDQRELLFVFVIALNGKQSEEYRKIREMVNKK